MTPIGLLESTFRLYTDGVISYDDWNRYIQNFLQGDDAEQPAQHASSDRYPHVCPKCAKPAYIGLSQVDCSGGCK